MNLYISKIGNDGKIGFFLGALNNKNGFVAEKKLPAFLGGKVSIASAKTVEVGHVFYSITKKGGEKVAQPFAKIEPAKDGPISTSGLGDNPALEAFATLCLLAQMKTDGVTQVARLTDDKVYPIDVWVTEAAKTMQHYSQQGKTRQIR